MRFLTSFIISALVAFSLLYGLILAVDPYNKFNYNLFGFETKAVDFARVNKFNQVEHGQKNYTAFIMGSSSAHRYETATLNELTGLVSYNYSTQSATPEDYLAMTRHILSKYKPKLLIISMDFEVLNKNVETDDMFFSSPLNNYLNEMPKEEKSTDLFNNSYLTLEAIGDSFKVIGVNLFGNARHAYLEDGNYKREKQPTSGKIPITQYDGRPYEFSEQRIAYLKTLKKLADENGIKVIILTAPLSLEHLNLIEMNFKPQHEKFKSILVNIFDEVWDFQNQTMAPYDSIQYFGNSNHVSHDFSNHLLRRIFGKESAPGILLKQ